MATDRFPPTPRTWIDKRLAEGAAGRDQVNRHLMDVYAWPLAVYCRALPAGRASSPDEIVRGFFADRLSRDDFLSAWRDSSLPLRRWLMNALRFYVFERAHRARRDRTEPAHGHEPVDDADPAEAYEQAYTVSVVHAACHAAQRSCEADGLGDHWQLFVAHVLNDEPYAVLAARFDVSEPRARVMARTARARFRQAVRDQLRRDRAAPGDEDDLDAEIRSLLGGR